MAKPNSGKSAGGWHGDYLWRKLCQGTEALYSLVGRAFPGRMMTAYRRAEASLSGGRHGVERGGFYPVSPWLRRITEALEHGVVTRFFRALMTALLCCPLAFYGLFGLLYGVGYTGHLVGMTRWNHDAWPIHMLILCGVWLLCSGLLLLSRHTLGGALGTSRGGQWILIRFLCLPAERLTRADEHAVPAPWGVVAALLGAGASAAVVYGDISPYVVPLGLLTLGICGLVFTYPEGGVVLSTAALPFVWLNRYTIFVVAALVILTWCAYAIKLLQLHRTLRMGLLDRVLLILGGYMLLSSFVGATITDETLIRGLLPVVLLGDYFLIVNLMTSRIYIRRCLLGVGVSLVIVTLLAYLGRMPVDVLDWLAGSRAGDALLTAFREAVADLSGLWQTHAEIYLVLAFPWLYAYLMHTRRYYRRALGGILLLADLGLILMTRSITATVCVMTVSLLFILFLGPKWTAAGIVALPVCAVGGWWLLDRFPISESFVITLSRSRHFKDQLRDSLWRMVSDYPAGIGAGEDAFTAVYAAYAAPDLGAVTESGSLFFEILLTYGWPGLLLLATTVFLFLQKGITCLGYTSARRDRAMLLGGIVSVCGMLIFGIFRSFLTVPRVFFTVTLVVALASAYANIIFDESDVLAATTAGSPRSEDRLYRRQS